MLRPQSKVSLKLVVQVSTVFGIHRIKGLFLDDNFNLFRLVINQKGTLYLYYTHPMLLGNRLHMLEADLVKGRIDTQVKIFLKTVDGNQRNTAYEHVGHTLAYLSENSDCLAPSHDAHVNSN